MVVLQSKVLMATKKQAGFTLIEVLIVIGLIAILAAIVIVAINPNRQFAQARNTQRTSDVNAILNATYQYAVDNAGAIPSTITTTVTPVCRTGGVCAGPPVLIDLAVLTTLERYLVSMPIDPSGTVNVNSTGYTIVKTANGRITVAAPQAELSVTISVTR